jgi:hypothetical protein
LLRSGSGRNRWLKLLETMVMGMGEILKNPSAELEYRQGRFASTQPTVSAGAPATPLPESASEWPDQLWHHVSAGGVLYYPMADLDFRPLHLVGHLVNVLLLVDWRYEETEFDGIVDIFLRGEGAADMPRRYEREPGALSYGVPIAEFLTVTGACSNFGLFREPARVPTRQPWCRMTRLRRSGGVQHQLWFFYMAGDCARIYQRLFIDLGMAPRFLWLQCPLGVNPGRWAEFISASGHLGRTFTNATQQPRYVVAHHAEPGWQHTVPSNRFKAWHPAWDLTCFSRKS